MRDKIISILKTKVYIYDKKLSYFLDDIEKIYDIVQSKILDIDCKNNILVSSERIGIDVCLLVIVAINTYLEDLKNYNNNIVSNLKTDQVVMYKGRKYKYKGCEVDKSGYFKDTEYIVLEARNGIQKIFKSDVYKLTRYFGKSEKLDKMGKNNESKEGRKLISKLLDLDINQLVGVLNQQILVVFKSKKYMQHILENLKIEINQQKYEFGTVFPARYYSDIDNFIDIKGNKLHLQNIFLFTSRFDVADLLIGEYSNCNKLILLEEESYYKSISIIEDYILDEEQLEKVIFYNTYNHIDRIVNLIENDASVYAIGEKENLKVKNILVESSKINGLLYITKTQLKSLLKPEFDFVKKDEFIKNTFKLLKIFQLICIPINKFNEKYIIDRGIKIINKITENTYQYTTIYEKLKCICENLRDLYDLLYTSNPKLNILEYISDKNSTIILNNNSEIEFISKNKKIKFKKLESINNLNNLKLQNQKLIFMSFYNNKYINQFNLYNNNNIINILYYIEAIKYNSIANNINRNLSIMYNNLNYVFEKNYIDLIKYDYKKIKKT